MSYTESKDMEVNPGKPVLKNITKTKSTGKKIDVGEPFTEVFYTENAVITVTKQKFVYE
ncbi:MAG: hypothetical protein KGZ97_08620 [Bacteroidetes bacterium]|nr:hypothetical protein [Bacteroidota bacterium]